MAGRRLNTTAEVSEILSTALGVVLDLSVDEDIQLHVFSAAMNILGRPPGDRDLEQLKADLLESIEITTRLAPPEGIWPTVFWAALERVSAREVLVSPMMAIPTDRKH